MGIREPWFKAQHGGWRYRPITWQGWAVMGVFAVYGIGAAATVQDWGLLQWLLMGGMGVLAVVIYLTSGNGQR